VRLNRYLAACGLGSRRACEALIEGGKVSINGHFIRDLATKVLAEDDVRVTGRRVRAPTATTVVLLHKPRGFLCTRSDDRGRRTIYDLLPAAMRRLASIGRLDRDSEGLLLLTDDGLLSQALTRPRHEVEKEYEVVLDAPLDPDTIPRLLRGMQLEGGKARMEKVALRGDRSVMVVLKQGLKRQIREMFFRVGREVKRLVRVRLGALRLGDLPSGAWRQLRNSEIAALRRSAKLDA
jgi:23S rRNA pseudouridine2605 synthase